MSSEVRPQTIAEERSPAIVYAWFCAVFLLLQGASTLAARLVPAIDRAFPLLLATTRMVPRHSLLHIATAMLALVVLALGARAVRWFAVLFGSSYAALGALGVASGSGNPGDLCGLTAGFGLQPFDHAFHILLGLLGVVAAWRTPRPAAGADEGPLASLPASPAEEP